MKILIIDDHELFAEGLNLLILAMRDDAEIICETSYTKAVETNLTFEADLVMLDFHIPGVEGFKALEGIKQKFPKTAVVIISSEESNLVIQQAIEKGASGFIPKSSSRDLLIGALGLVTSGGVYLPSQLLDKVQSGDGDESSALTRQQKRVVSLAVTGALNKQIASELDIAEGTVKAHLSAAYRSLNVKNRTEAVMAVAKRNINLLEWRWTVRHARFRWR